MLRSYSLPELAIRYSVSRVTIWNWVKAGKFSLPAGMGGRATFKDGRTWRVDKRAVMEYERALFMSDSAIRVVYPTSALRIFIDNDDDILETCMRLLHENGGTIVVNRHVETATFFGLARKARLDYMDVMKQIVMGNLIIWHKDKWRGEYYRICPTEDMVI